MKSLNSEKKNIDAYEKYYQSISKKRDQKTDIKKRLDKLRGEVRELMLSIDKYEAKKLIEEVTKKTIDLNEIECKDVSVLEKDIAAIVGYEKSNVYL